MLLKCTKVAIVAMDEIHMKLSSRGGNIRKRFGLFERSWAIHRIQVMVSFRGGYIRKESMLFETGWLPCLRFVGSSPSKFSLSENDWSYLNGFDPIHNIHMKFSAWGGYIRKYFELFARLCCHAWNIYETLDLRWIYKKRIKVISTDFVVKLFSVLIL